MLYREEAIVSAVHNMSTGWGNCCERRRRQRTFCTRQSPLCVHLSLTALQASLRCERPVVPADTMCIRHALGFVSAPPPLLPPLDSLIARSEPLRPFRRRPVPSALLMLPLGAHRWATGPDSARKASRTASIHSQRRAPIAASIDSLTLQS